MKYIKTHESFNVNYEPTNEVFGLALIAGAGLALFAPNIYREVKQFWSKHVIGEKYKETGNVEKVICKFDKKNISPSVSSLTVGERESGEVEIILKEYKDNFGNTYYGYDHSSPTDTLGNFTTNASPESGSMNQQSYYTAMYKAEDLNTLKTWLSNGKRYEGRGAALEIKPVDIIYRADIRNASSSGTPIS